MRSDAPSLMPIFRSQHQAELLTQLYLHPEREYTLTELAEGASVPASTAHREIARLLDAGLVISRPVGRSRLHRANAAHPGARALTDLLLLTFGAARVVAEEFADVPNADRVLLFGSWAARRTGLDGPPPADVDVLVVGHPRRADAYAAAERAARRLQLPVNPVLRTPEQWAAADDALVAQVQQSEHVTVLDRVADAVGSPADPVADDVVRR